MMIDDIEKVIYSEEEIAKRVKELGAQITKDFAGHKVVCLGVLKGSFVFMADIVRAIDLDCEIDFMAVSSYGNGTTTTGAVEITKDISTNIEGKDVIIIEDILDSGVTLSYLKRYLSGMNPASVSICTILDKAARRQTDIKADYIGFDCPDEFIVGYGLDYAQRYRNFPAIGVLKRSVYEK